MTHTNRSRLAVDLGGAWRIYWGNGPLPVGAQALGTITRGIGDIGALIRMGIGSYVQGNAGVLRSLDHRKVESAIEIASPGRGGARLGGGRKTSDGVDGVVRKNVTLDHATINKMRAIGDGDLSLGIRRAAVRIGR